MPNTMIEARIDLACGQLRMTGLEQQYHDLVRDAADSNMKHLTFLAACLEQEVHKRQELKQLSLLRQAKFPMPKTLLEFQFAKIPKLPKMKVEQLAQGEFVTRRENVICIGKTGRGKSHIAIAIAMGSMQNGHQVRFISVMQFIQLIKGKFHF